MPDETMFFKNDLRLIIENQQKTLIEELDRMSDHQLLNTSLSELESYCSEKYSIDLPQLGEPQVDHRRTKMRVGRYGQDYGWGNEGSVEVDAHQYKLEVPFSGDEILFWTRGSTWNSAPPHGSVRAGVVSSTVQMREPDANKLNGDFDKFVADLKTWFGFLAGDIGAWNGKIPSVVNEHVGHRRARAETADSAAFGLKFALKSRPEAPATYTAPVAQKKIAPVLPKPKPGVIPEPVLSDEAYRDVINTLQQMSEVMERSPHAFAQMDEETLRFQFLVPLNAKFEGEARGEAFNYSGKTDILITHKGRNIFIAELKIWTGAAALTEAIDQLLGYLSWRDTKTALVIFNRNKNFSGVLNQIEPTVRAHPNFIADGGKHGETEYRFTFHHRNDPSRRLTLTVLAFDLPKD